MVSLRNWSCLLGAIAFATTTIAQTTNGPPVSRFCPDGQSVCAQVNIPEGSSMDTFLQVQAPTSSGWSGIGIGTNMVGSLLFVVYPSGDGKNVTVSPRLAQGHFEPLFEDTIKFQLLDGSGVDGDLMTANIKCSNCRSWSGGNGLNIKSNNQDFVWAKGPGEDIQSNNPEQTITQHATVGNFRLDVAKATGGDGRVNPFTAPAQDMNTSNTSDGISVAAPVTNADRVLIAHGVIMALTWVILFPLGAAFIRQLSRYISNAFIVHRTLQLFNVVLAITGMAMGMWASGLDGTHFTHFHQYLGVILVGMLFVQGALGYLHHAEFQRIGKHSKWSYMHIWFGRSVIVLGIINGGIGLGPRLADASDGQIAAYSIVCVFVVGSYTISYLLQSRGDKLSNRG